MKSAFVKTNGINMHYLEAGEGPLVLLLHGFPELGFSWRHQISALANAGYRVVAPDQRGYGKTDRPENPAEFTLCHLVGDIVGLIHALGEEHAAVIGHDWGASVTWTSALLRPDIFSAIGLLSVPYLSAFWSGPYPTAVMKELLSSGPMFYQLYFQEPGKADQELAKDTRDSLLRMYVGASGSAEKRWRYLFSPQETFLDTLPKVNEIPRWLSEDEVAFVTDSFKRTGFTGGLNWYRNMDRDRELLAFLAAAKIGQPSIFLAGAEDPVVEMYQRDYDLLDQTMPGLTTKALIPGAGHWVQQEKPEEVSRHLLQFLSAAWPARSGRAIGQLASINS
jgi:pimeloyl-ACP methyl ester carboxylesterase